MDMKAVDMGDKGAYSDVSSLIWRARELASLLLNYVDSECGLAERGLAEGLRPWK